MSKKTPVLIGFIVAFVSAVLFFGYLQLAPTTYVCIQETTSNHNDRLVERQVLYVQDHRFWFTYEEPNTGRSFSSGLLSSVSDKNHGEGYVNHTELGLYGKKITNSNPVFYHNDYVYRVEKTFSKCDKK